MIDFLKTLTTSDWIQLGTCVVEIIAVLFAVQAIDKGSKQKLFDDRRSAYLLSKELLETYKYYITKCNDYDNEGHTEPVALSQRYKWLTNSSRLISIRDAIDDKDGEKMNEQRNKVLSECAKLEEQAEIIGMLWKRGDRYWYAKEVRDFVKDYAGIIQAIFRYEFNKKRYEYEKRMFNKMNSDAEKEMLLECLAVHKTKMNEAEKRASQLDDHMSELYNNRIYKKSTEKPDTNGEKPEEALIAMKDSIRL